MYTFTLTAVLISVACGALLSAPSIENQLMKFDKLVDVIQSRVVVECPKESWQVKHVKRAVAKADTSITEPELQLENLKVVYAHFLSTLSKCRSAAAAALKLKERERAAKAKAAALAKRSTPAPKPATTKAPTTTI